MRLECESQTEADIALEMICKQRGLRTAVWCEEAQNRVWVNVDDVHRIPYHREQWNVCNSADYVVGCLRACMSSLCCMLFQIHCKRDTMIQEVLGSLSSGYCIGICVCLCIHTHTHTHTRIAIWWKHLPVYATYFQSYKLISHVATLVAK